ncbi:hematopoietic prostaglandin D synthase-like isoform X2 [Panulirus ornatus]
MTYHLAYMDLRARGEPIRWILKAVGATYTEERIDIFKQWLARKPEFEWGRVPVLVVEGKQLHQTVVICRYLGEKHHLSSSDLWTATRQQEVVEAIHDPSESVGLAFLSRVRQDEKLQTAMAEKVKKRLPELVTILESRITDHGWILSTEMTWVDVFVAAYLDIYESLLPGMLEGHPKCQCLLARVKDLPPIKAWLQERPAFHKFEDPEGIF